jgi:hypothetical protein
MEFATTYINSTSDSRDLSREVCDAVRYLHDGNLSMALGYIQDVMIQGRRGEILPPGFSEASQEIYEAIIQHHTSNVETILNSGYISDVGVYDAKTSLNAIKFASKRLGYKIPKGYNRLVRRVRKLSR